MIVKHTGLCIDKSPIHGWGVFTKEDIKKGELVEECPMASKKKYGYLGDVDINPYLMSYDANEIHHTWFIPTGYSIHLNHSDTENLYWKNDLENDICSFYAKRDIKANEELFINYNNAPSR